MAEEQALPLPRETFIHRWGEASDGAVERKTRAAVRRVDKGVKGA